MGEERYYSLAELHQEEVSEDWAVPGRVAKASGAGYYDRVSESGVEIKPEMPFLEADSYPDALDKVLKNPNLMVRFAEPIGDLTIRKTNRKYEIPGPYNREEELIEIIDKNWGGPIALAVSENVINLESLKK